MAIGDRIRARRVARGWTDADFKAAEERRSNIWNGLKVVSAVIPVPGVGAAVGAAAAVADKLDNKPVKASRVVDAIAAAAPEAFTAAVDKVVAAPTIPEVTSEVGNLLKDPLVRYAAESAQRIIDEIEKRTGMDIPEAVEQQILDVCLDVFDDVYEEAEEQIKKYGQQWLQKAVQWLKGVFTKA